jgi:hypothetical protein
MYGGNPRAARARFTSTRASVAGSIFVSVFVVTDEDVVFVPSAATDAAAVRVVVVVDCTRTGARRARPIAWLSLGSASKPATQIAIRQKIRIKPDLHDMRG